MTQTLVMLMVKHPAAKVAFVLLLGMAAMAACSGDENAPGPTGW